MLPHCHVLLGREAPHLRRVTRLLVGAAAVFPVRDRPHRIDERISRDATR